MKSLNKNTKICLIALIIYFLIYLIVPLLVYALGFFSPIGPPDILFLLAFYLISIPYFTGGSSLILFVFLLIDIIKKRKTVFIPILLLIFLISITASVIGRDISGEIWLTLQISIPVLWIIYFLIYLKNKKLRSK